MPTKRSTAVRSSIAAALTSAVRARLRAYTSDLLELAGLAGVAASVAGLTHNPWWGGLTGSIALVILGIASDPGAGPRP